MNQHINQETMWKNPNLIQSPESNVKRGSVDKINESDGAIQDLVYVNESSELYDCSANGNSFDDTAYHGLEKPDCDRSSFNPVSSKMTPTSKAKDLKNYNEIEPGSFANGIFNQNNNDVPLSKVCQNSEQPVPDELLWFYLDPRNNIQGPFLDSQMFQWWSQGIYFQNSLMMKRKCDADFSTLQDYSNRFNGVPFNRKDIRIPPLIESMTVQSSVSGNPYISPQMYSGGILPPMHRNSHQVPSINDQNYILQLMSSVPNTSPEELSKILQKLSVQQRIPPQMGYDESLVTPSIHNGVDPFLSGVESSSLSNFVNLRLNNPKMPQTSSYTEGHIGNYVKNDRFPATSWGQMHHQPNLVDSVWTSTSDDTISNSNPVWSRSTNEAATTRASLLNTIFPESQHSAINIPINPYKSSLMQETWDNLDPAIIKIVPQGDPSNHPVVNTCLKDPSAQIGQRTHHSSSNNPTWSNSESGKQPWADLVRKNSTGTTSNQKSKSGYSFEQDLMGDSVQGKQHKASLSSTSSDEYEQMSRQSLEKDVESLIQWSKSYLENKPGIVGVDIGTLMELLIYLESPYELEATMRENVPEFDNICEFVRIFVEKRRPLRQRLFSDNPKKKNDKSVPPKQVDDDTKWQIKSKSQHGSCKKKRKNNTKN